MIPPVDDDGGDPFLIGQNPQPLDRWHGSNLGWIEYAVEVPRELLNLWDDVALQ
jgi:hypothetical protein